MLLLLMTACATMGLPEPTDAMAAASPGTTVASLAEGRELVLDRCGNCHMVWARDVLDPAWPETWPVMEKKAKLEPGQAERIEAYLLAASRPLPETPTAAP